MDHATRAEFLFEFRVLRVVRIFRFLFRIEVVEVAEELIETVGGGQHFVAVAEMVFAKLAGHVALRLEQGGDRRVFLLHAFWGAGQANLGEAGADG